ncbi:MAG TPA: hypothetical protein VMW87_14800 [Spirochaetia bacterium]|nr:hypothetical protein [Spirochaetia bacterium]
MAMKVASRRLLPALAVAALVLAGGVAFAQTAEYHGADSVFRDHGLTILWAILKGKDEDSSSVYVRIAKSGPASEQLGLFSVVARDVISGDEQVVIPRRVLNDLNTITEERGSFTDKAQRRFLFYRGRDTAGTADPAVEVYYYAIPDTAPEFLTAAAAEAYLKDTLERVGASR